MIPKFDISKNYHYIVDTSYIVFCAAAVAFKEYAYQNDVLTSEMGPDFDPTVDPEFNNILNKYFIARVVNPIKNYIPFSYDKSNFIFSIDCPRSEIWRRDVYPEYKLNRDTLSHEKDQFNIGKVFDYVNHKIIPDFCNETGSIIIQCTSSESDDIIAIVTEKLLEDESNNVIILSSDRDMVQLCNERVVVIANQSDIRDPKKEIEKMTRVDGIKEDISASDFLLFKIIIGDGSDNIPSIKPRLGPKGALKLILDKSRSKLKNLLNSNIDIKNGFKRNKKMISMKMIPDYIKNLIIESYDEAKSRKSVI